MDNWSLYVHTNKVNNKTYVGITSMTPERRWKNGNGYKGQLFYNAIAKYGWDGFEHKVLFSGLSEEQAKRYEQYYISLYQSSANLNGYNVSAGGDVCKFHNKNRVMSDEVRDTVSQTATVSHSYRIGSHQSEETKEKVRQAHIGHNVRTSNECGTLNKVIICINNETNVETVYNSIVEAGKATGINRKRISNCLLNRYTTTGIYSWREATKEEVVAFVKEGLIAAQTKTVNLDCRPVIATNIETNEEIEFPSINSASNQTGTSHTVIEKCFITGQASSSGYRWRQKGDQQKYSDIPMECAITSKAVIMTLNKKEARFESVREATRETGFSYKVIRRCIETGKATANGATWKCAA